jgi:glycosyltransferase involved in cell wall biosynthesis
LKILILSPYNAVSHNHLNRGLIKYLPEIDFTLLTLEPRYFAWRSRGNSLSFAYEKRAELEQSFDLIFATSITDITSLKGFVPSLANIPVIVYFHENQFAYPDSRSGFENVEAKIVSIYNALAADRVVFNTEYNMLSFMKGAESFLKKMPDHVPAGLVQMISQKSQVINVPIEKNTLTTAKTDPPAVLWNHRWEYDKAPDRFLQCLKILKNKGVSFSLNVIGQVFRDVPESFNVIREEFADVIVNFGYAADKTDYHRILSESRVVVSTSLHDFQGLAVMEAAEAGCVPVLPDRLAYPCIFDAEYLYGTCENTDTEAENCADMIVRHLTSGVAPDMSDFHWENLLLAYSQLFYQTARLTDRQK